MTDPELRSLLRDCLLLWDTPGKLTPADDGMAIETNDGRFVLQRAAPGLLPIRWLLQTPERAAAARPPRAMPSIVAALSALRNALGAAHGPAPRIGV